MFAPTAACSGVPCSDCLPSSAMAGDFPIVRPLIPPVPKARNLKNLSSISSYLPSSKSSTRASTAHSGRKFSASHAEMLAAELSIILPEASDMSFLRWLILSDINFPSLIC